ncbi:hypothetical protein [Leptospira idonii]|uniref:Uncharacterized protein n=1 Tax=Leptospira idonii TaxID=1193500 RepID=A0A4V3JY04_9LEPT|nr:hypothetical protein [Leptospira idonii]TGN19306.1 hypothetical protein EHS15_09395 [Leptospira idonii]
MGSGYHSRSPEEFREYLKSMQKQGKRIKWKQVIIIIDVLLLLFVFYLAFRALNPGSFQSPTQSEKKKIAGNEAYLSLSRENDDLSQGYFLFIENNTNENLILPKKDWKLEFRILTREGVVCYTEEMNIPEKKIPTYSKGFLYHSVSLLKLRELEEHCRTEVFDETYSFFRSKFRYMDLAFFSEWILTTQEERVVYRIRQKPYRWNK